MTVEDINNQGKYLYSTIQYISKTQTSLRRLVSEESIVLCCTSASIGKLAILKTPMATNQQFNGITPIVNNSIDIEYAYIYFSLLKNKLIEIAGITTFPFVSTDKLGNLFFPLPSLIQQKLISSKVNKLLNYIE